MNVSWHVAAEIVAWLLAAWLLGLIFGVGLSRQRIRRLRVQLLQRPVHHLDRRRAVLVNQLDHAVEIGARKDRLIVALEEEIDLLGRLLKLKDDADADPHPGRGARPMRGPERDEIRRRIAVVRRIHDELGEQLAELAGTIEPARRPGAPHPGRPAEIEVVGGNSDRTMPGGSGQGITDDGGDA